MDALPATLPAWIEWATLATIFVGMVWDGARLRIPHSVCLIILLLMPAWGHPASDHPTPQSRSSLTNWACVFR